MKKPPLTIVAKMRAKKGKETELRAALIGLIQPTRSENGCINYDLHESLDEPGLFIFYENWSSTDALNHHFETPHILKLQKKAPELLEGPLELFRLEMVSDPAF